MNLTSFPVLMYGLSLAVMDLPPDTEAHACADVAFPILMAGPHSVDIIGFMQYFKLLTTAVQVVKLGSPVTAVQLSPGQDLLATCHVKRRGIYLWYNHLVFGSGADIQPSTRPVNAALPSIASGDCLCHVPSAMHLMSVSALGKLHPVVCIQL